MTETEMIEHYQIPLEIIQEYEILRVCVHRRFKSVAA